LLFKVCLLYISKMYHRVKTRAHKKRKMHQGSMPSETAIDEKIVRGGRARGGNVKKRLSSTVYANVLVHGKPEKGKILVVKDNPASKDYTRRNIITKGAMIEVDVGGKKIHAKVTSRPGQDGVVNAKVM